MATSLRAATPAQIVKGLEATNDPADVADLLSRYAPPNMWALTAYLSMCQREGTALTIEVTRHAYVAADGSAYLHGTYGHNPAWYLPYPAVYAAFWAPELGTYACTFRMARGLPYDEPFGSYVFGMHTFENGTLRRTALGSLEIGSLTPENFTFLVRLNRGRHTFGVRPATHVGFSFYSLTVTRVPELAPPWSLLIARLRRKRVKPAPGTPQTPEI